jgi:hypothetical protein
MIYSLPQSIPPRMPRARRGRRQGLGQVDMQPYTNLLNATGTLSAGELSQLTPSDILTGQMPGTPAPETLSDIWSNALGLPMTQNEAASNVTACQQEVLAACGTDTTSTQCQTSVAQCAQNVNAAANQSNQQLCGFPYSVVGCPNVGGNPQVSTTVPVWVWLVAAAVGLFAIYEFAS